MGKSLQTWAISLPMGSIDAYIQQVNRIPLVSAEEEKNLATRWQEHGDLAAARQLVLSHLRFVVNIARGYSGYGLAQTDLIQEGNIGLMKAVKRFDPKVGVRLVSFAVHWIKAEMHEFILRNWRIVKVATTKAQRKLFFNLRKASKRLSWFSKAEIETVAKDLNVSTEQVRIMESRLNNPDQPLDTPVHQFDNHEEWSPIHYLEDPQANPAQQLEATDWEEWREQGLRQAMDQLDERSRDILESRWLVEKKATLHDLAAKYKLSAERVRQLEQMAMKKIKDFLGSVKAITA